MSTPMVINSITQTANENESLERQYVKGVKNLCENGINKVPNKYILPELERPIATITGASPFQVLNLQLPIIDFAELQGSNRSQVLKSLKHACQNYGFFQLVNHGIATDIINSMIEVGTKFFEQPFDVREKYMSNDIEAPVRYGTSFNQTKDGVFCWRDFLKLVCHPLSEVLSHWPTSPMDLRKPAANYAKETRLLFLMLVDAILESLGVTENDEVLREMDDGSQLMVVNCYPSCPEPNLTLGMPPHSDYGFLTLLLQDEVEGLQIEHQDKWFTIQPITNSFVVNVGDHLEIFSNGIYKSVLHRVLVNSLKSRISVASLHSVPFKGTIKPHNQLINENTPRLYKDTDFPSFLHYISTCDSKKKNFIESRKVLSCGN